MLPDLLRPLRFRAALLVTAASLVAVSGTGPAWATDPTACVGDHARGQDDRKAGKLRAARESFIRCAAEDCPKVVREDCASLLAQVDSSMASVVVHATGPDGQDTDDVVVIVDGEQVADRLGATAIPLEPGDHAVKFRHRSGRTREQHVRLLEGGKNRVLEVDFSDPAPVRRPASAPAQPRTGLPVTVWVLGGVSAVALGSFAYFALDGRSKEKDVDRCSPNCSDAEYDAMMKRYLIADISLAVSAVAGGAALTIALTSKPTAAEPKLGLSPTRGGTALRFGTRF